MTPQAFRMGKLSASKRSFVESCKPCRFLFGFFAFLALLGFLACGPFSLVSPRLFFARLLSQFD